MHVRVLGCSGSIAAGSHTTSVLVGDDLLIDAGTGVGLLPLQEMARIDHILVTHSHLDHVLAIGLLADSVLRIRHARGAPPVLVHALPETIDALRRHIFNGVIWPDFTRLPSPERPMLAFAPLRVGQVLALGAHRVEVLPAAHTVPAVGYAVLGATAQAGAWVFTGDTGPNPALWARLAELPVAALVIETAFRDDEQAVASASGHLHPAQLQAELGQLARPTDVFITHVKPGEVDAVMAEITALPTRHRIRVLQPGQLMALG